MIKIKYWLKVTQTFQIVLCFVNCVMLCFDDSSGKRLYFTFLLDLTLAVGENPCLHHYNFGGGAAEVANLG